MKRTEIKKLYENSPESGADVTVCGWVKSVRVSKGLAFLSISDGSCFKQLQIVAESEKVDDFEAVSHLNTGAAISVGGKVVLTPNAKQPLEINAESITVEGASTPDYPLQKKGAVKPPSQKDRQASLLRRYNPESPFYR